VVGEAVKQAVKDGYRHLDLAANYLNEKEIGDALTELFAEGVVKREELFITSKLNNPYHHKEHVRPALEKTLLDLNLTYLDLYLIHWPVAFHYVPYDQSKRGFHEGYDPDGLKELDLSKFGGWPIDTTVSYGETWKAMEELVDAGLTKHIGVSNLTAVLLHDVLTYARIQPAVNQIELHPLLQQNALLAFCAKRNIVVQAYSPLGTSDFKKPEDPSLLSLPEIGVIAAKHNKSPAQVLLGWAVQRGTVALPKSVNPSRVVENASIFDFVLDEEDLAAIAKLDRDFHFLRPNDWHGVPLFGHC